MNQTITRALFLASLLTIAGCGVVDNQQYIENAKKFADKGDFKSALIELKNALQQDPENSITRIYLAQIYLNTGDYPAAEKELKKAQQLGADDNDVSPGLSQVLLHLRKFDEVLAMQVGNLEPSTQGHVLAAQGLALLVSEKPQKAVELTERALAIAANSAYVHVARANTYLIAEKSPEKAREQLHLAFGIDKDYPAAWALLGDIEANAKNWPIARDAYTKSITLQPTSLTNRYKRVTINILLNDLKQAQFDLDILKKQLPNSPGIAFSQGVVYLASEQIEDAKSAFDLALLDQERYPLSLFYLAYISYQQGNIAQAETHAERFFTLNPDYLPNRKLLAEIKFKKQDYEGVERLLNPIVNSTESDEGVQNTLAKTLLAQGKTAEGITLLNQIVERNPESAEARFRLGAGLMMSGDHQGGITQLEIAIEQDKDNYQAEVYRILSFLKLRQMEQAHQAANEFQSRAPDSEIPHNMIGLIHITERNFDAAREALEKSWNIKPGNTDAGHNLATIASREKNYDKARMYLDAVIAAHPDNLETLIKLAELDAQEGKTQQQIQRLEKAMRLYPTVVKPRLVLAEHYINTGNPGQVSGLIETLDLVTKKQLPVLEVIANQFLAQKDFKSAAKTASEIIDRNPNVPQGYFLMAKALAGMGEHEKVEKMLNTAMQKDGRYLPARIVWVRLLLSKHDMAAAEHEVATLKSIADDNESVMKLEVNLAEMKGNHQQAIKNAEQLFEAFPNIGNMLVLSRQKMLAGDDDGALGLRAQWADSHANEYYPNLVAAVTYTRKNQGDLAVKYYQRALAAAPESILVLNNLAWSLRNTDPGQALIYAQKANRLKPGTVLLMDTLAMVYLANKNHEMALRTIKDVLFLEPENPTLSYHEALINASAGKNNMAVQILSRLLKEAGEFPEKAEAAALLEKLNNG